MGKDRRGIAVGTVLGKKYRIDRIIGAGGVGVIAAATHVELGQKVAVKLLRPDVDSSLKERFLREARAAVKLRGDHVARVSDVGRAADGTPYFVMELLSGEDLATVAARGRLSVEVAVALVLQACEGLAEAHANHMIHRDLKPRNLFLCHRVDGSALVKVLDFGIAKVRDPTDPNAKDLTSTGTVFGSPQYMSPEQMRTSRDMDVRTDIWSLGVCLYELLTGKPPFDAPTMPLLCVKVLKEEPVALDEARPDVPVELSDVVMRCLQKDRDMRYADVAELAAALEPFAPSAHGAASRVRTILHEPHLGSAPPPALGLHDARGDTATAGTIDTRARTGSVWQALLVAALTVIIGAGAIVTVVSMSRRSPVVEAVPEPPQVSPPPSAISVVAPPPVVETVVTSVPTVVAPPGHSARPFVGHRTPPPAPAQPSASGRPDCNPNFVVDSTGQKHFKPECF